MWDNVFKTIVFIEITDWRWKIDLLSKTDMSDFCLKMADLARTEGETVVENRK
jgi:hypothetical protein